MASVLGSSSTMLAVAEVVFLMSALLMLVFTGAGGSWGSEVACWLGVP